MIEVLIGGYYNHYKNKPYKVLDIGKSSEDMLNYVVYKTLYVNETAKTWIRPYAMFMEEVNGKPRFALQPPSLWPIPFEKFHSHVYFDEKSMTQAEAFHAKFKQTENTVSPLRLELRGPHPSWMFTVNFTAANFMETIEFMQKNREGLNILVHPLSGNEILDHTDYAMFLGEKVDLNLSIFSK